MLNISMVSAAKVSGEFRVTAPEIPYPVSSSKMNNNPNSEGTKEKAAKCVDYNVHLICESDSY